MKTGFLFLTIFLSAYAAAQTASPALKPLSQTQILGLIHGGVASARVESLIRKRGLDFAVTASFVNQLKQAGASPSLIQMIEARPIHKVMQPPAPRTLDRTKQPAASPESAMFAEAQKLTQQNDWPDAEAVYVRILRLDPSSLDAHFNLGHVLKKEKKFDQSIAEYRDAIRLAPDLPPPHFNLGNVLLAKNDFAHAAAEYRTVLQMQPQDCQAHYALGFADYKMGKVPEAVKEFRVAIALQNSYSDAHTALGIAYLQDGLYSNALQEFHQALRLNPQDPLAHAGLGNTLLKQGDRKGALEEYRFAASLEPNNLTYRGLYEELRQKVNP